MVLCAKWYRRRLAALCQRLQRLWVAIPSHFRHLWQRRRHLDVSHLHIASCVYLCNAPHSLTGITLFAISWPVLCAFLGFAVWMGQVEASLSFALLYCAVAGVCLALSLIIGYLLCMWLWKLGLVRAAFLLQQFHRAETALCAKDPDVNALPLLSSSMDVCAHLLLALAFIFSGVADPA